MGNSIQGLKSIAQTPDAGPQGGDDLQLNAIMLQFCVLVPYP